MNRLVSCTVLVLAVGLVLSACGGNGGPSAELTSAEVPDRGLVVTYPVDWHLADETLTPNLAGPMEVFTVGSFPLRPGGPNCAHAPVNAMHDLGPEDALVTVQERRTTNTEGFEPRPASFGLDLGYSDSGFPECMSPAERGDVGLTRWIWFTDENRYFHVLVVIGREASSETAAAAWAVLDALDIEERAEPEATTHR